MRVGSLLLLVKGNVAFFAAVVFFNAHDLIAVRCVLRPIAATECSIGAGKPAVKATAGRYVVRIIVVILALMTYRVCGVMHITVMTGETDVTDGSRT